MTPLDDRRLIVDAFARWRISDVSQFRRAVGVGGMQAATQRLEAILNANVREALGSVRSEAVLSADRVGLMNRIRDAAIIEARDLGIEIIDVRLKRADLPEQNLAATFDRMKAEREREAADERARGNEAAQRVRAQADRTAIEIVSEAERDAQVIRGESDAERNRILAEAYGADPEFFAFMRSMDAYRGALKADNATHDGRARQRLLRLPALAGAARRAPDAAGRGARGAGAVRQRRRGPEWLTATCCSGSGCVAIVEGLALALAPAQHARGAGGHRPHGPRAAAAARAPRGDRRHRPCLGGAGVRSCGAARRRTKA